MFHLVLAKLRNFQVSLRSQITVSLFTYARVANIVLQRNLAAVINTFTGLYEIFEEFEELSKTLKADKVIGKAMDSSSLNDAPQPQTKTQAAVFEHRS